VILEIISRHALRHLERLSVRVLRVNGADLTLFLILFIKRIQTDVLGQINVYDKFVI